MEHTEIVLPPVKKLKTEEDPELEELEEEGFLSLKPEKEKCEICFQNECNNLNFHYFLKEFQSSLQVPRLFYKDLQSNLRQRTQSIKELRRKVSPREVHSIECHG